MSEVTRILAEIGGGEQQAASRLLPLVYDELRRLAAAKMAHEKPGQTLGATALVHEAYLRLVGDGADTPWNSRGHFFAAAAEAMRRILVENARRKRQLKQGGGLQRLALSDIEPADEDSPDDLLALDDALARLENHDPLAAEIVKLRFFGGLSMPEIAQSLGIALRTAERNWTYARTWLHRELS